VSTSPGVLDRVWAVTGYVLGAALLVVFPDKFIVLLAMGLLYWATLAQGRVQASRFLKFHLLTMIVLYAFWIGFSVYLLLPLCQFLAHFLAGAEMASVAMVLGAVGAIAPLVGLLVFGGYSALFALLGRHHRLLWVTDNVEAWL
jgi:hypothetical protein